MTSWTVAPALLTFAAQVRELAPGARVDTIGDAAHSARRSDHNPDADRMVCACDVHDHPALDDHALALTLADPAHAVDWPRIKYLINESSIWSPARADEGWRLYTGPNPHRTHCHLSVTQAGKRDARRWSALDALLLPAPAPREDDPMPTAEQIAAALLLPAPAPREDDPMPTAEQIAAALRPVLQQEVNRALAILTRGEDLATGKPTGHANLAGLATRIEELDVPRRKAKA